MSYDYQMKPILTKKKKKLKSTIPKKLSLNYVKSNSFLTCTIHIFKNGTKTSTE